MDNEEKKYEQLSLELDDEKGTPRETIQNDPDSLSESILDSIKKMIGILSQDTNFDVDIIIHINGAFTTLRQLGVGPEEGYAIKSAENKWSEFITDESRLDSVKTYVYLKVKTVFDPPLNASLMESFQSTIKELEWRLNVAAETK